MGYTLPGKALIKCKTDFQDVYATGSRLNVYPLRICYREMPRPGKSRLGLAIGKKSGNAVIRNRWKRAIREAFRIHRNKIKTPCDIVVSVSWNAGSADIKCTCGALLEAIKRINESLIEI